MDMSTFQEGTLSFTPQTDLYSALAKVSAFIENAVANKRNDHYKSYYADLPSIREAVVKPLADHGLFIMHELINTDGKWFCKTSVVHTSGQSISTLVPLLFDKQDMQSVGKACTYAKKVGITLLLNISHEKDDDGEDLRKQHEKFQSEKRLEADLNEFLTKDKQTYFASEITRLNMKETYSALFGNRKPETWTRKDLKALNELLIVGEKKLKETT